ncbi:MAG: hypothetical protein UT21_C0006G0043 [Candidatus Woesebacteria bacterium GW2011_GWA1_39_11b]|nr:MAG: hypothetical protein UT21_C0006G0043 [Candidatus Woesebacteria bacterium GW2011_GWA1_39_11b]KKS77121.1 MAG: hypothetical protein UV51_C0010G0026 [Candidatus Woesebacteria bacterium GW2011_GWC1_42_9]
MTPDQEAILKQVLALQEKAGIKMRRIENVLTGDKDFKIEGLVDKVDKFITASNAGAKCFHHEKELADMKASVQTLKDDKNRIIGGAWVGGGILGFFAAIFQKWISG